MKLGKSIHGELDENITRSRVKIRKRFRDEERWPRTFSKIENYIKNELYDIFFDIQANIRRKLFPKQFRPPR